MSWFKWDPVPPRQLESETGPDGRRYLIPTGEWVPSVTTVIGRSLDHSWLDEWVARVGEEEASRVSGRARTRGSSVHLLAERYVQNDPHWAKGAMPVNLYTFRPARETLDRHLGTVFAQEYPLFSTRLRTAGRVDLVCEWEGRPAVLDFKTSSRPLGAGVLAGYFVQACCYAAMIAEDPLFKDHPRLSNGVETLVLVVMVDHEPVQVAVATPGEWAQEVERVFVTNRLTPAA